MAQFFFQVVAVDPQEQHVPRQVQPAAVQEHRGDHRLIPVARHDPGGDKAPGQKEAVQVPVGH